MPMGIVDNRTPNNGINEHTNTNIAKKGAPDTPSTQSPPVVRNVFHNAINSWRGVKGSAHVRACVLCVSERVRACEREIVRAG